jgi:hypothetical protein
MSILIHDFTNLTLSTDGQVDGDKILILPTIDSRPEIIDKAKSNSYVGTMRSLTMIPYNINTKNRVPFSLNMTENAINVLSNKGFKCSGVST